MIALVSGSVSLQVVRPVGLVVVACAKESVEALLGLCETL